MKYFSEVDAFVNAECEKCGKILKIKRVFCTKKENGFELDTPVKCLCGEESKYIYGKSTGIHKTSSRENKPTKDDKNLSAVINLITTDIQEWATPTTR